MALQIPLNWMRDFVDWSLADDDLAEAVRRMADAAHDAQGFESFIQASIQLTL